MRIDRNELLNFRLLFSFATSTNSGGATGCGPATTGCGTVWGLPIASLASERYAPIQRVTARRRFHLLVTEHHHRLSGPT
jgi:hypothetical protein